ncbi:MAG: helix-turn-helix domain-containing protein [Candidatus Aceula meridiana]|nr:helix-turn-helix domain-containing protein [Candidatus Aceula meridiana]
MADQFISVREAAQALRISERKIMELVDEERLQAYRIAGQFIRFKRSDVLSLKSAGTVASETTHHEYTRRERFYDFIYFNDFYILSFFIVLFFLYIIFTNA